MDEQAKREAEEFEAARAKHDQRLTVLIRSLFFELIDL